MTQIKIKINDDPELREQIDILYENIDHVSLSRWAISLVKHIMDVVDFEYHVIDEITEGFRIVELWQQEKARVYDVRQASLSIHRVARQQTNDLRTTVLRAVGQAVASGHMREHAIVSSDYSIKVINLLKPNEISAVRKERNWQISELKKYIK